MSNGDWTVLKYLFAAIGNMTQKGATACDQADKGNVTAAKEAVRLATRIQSMGAQIQEEIENKLNPKG